MNIAFTFKNFEASDHLKKYARRRMEKMGRFFGKASGLEVGVVLTVDKFRHRCEVTIAGEGLHLSASEQSSDMYAAIDLVVDKVEAQIKKHVSRVKEQRRQARNASVDVFTYNLEADPDEEPAVVGTERFAPKPLHLDEALMQLESIGSEFLVFINAETDRVNVVYRRRTDQHGRHLPCRLPQHPADHRADERGAGVNMLHENIGHISGHHIPQQPAAHAGEYADEHQQVQGRRFHAVPCHADTHDRENTKACAVHQQHKQVIPPLVAHQQVPHAGEKHDQRGNYRHRGGRRILKRRRGHLELADLPARFREQCKSSAPFTAAVNSELRALIYRRQLRSRLRENRMAAYGQYRYLAGVLDAISEDLRCANGSDTIAERRLVRYLNSLDIDAEVSVFRDPTGRLRAVIESARLPILFREADYMQDVSDALGVRMCRPASFNQNDTRLVLLEAEPLAVSVGVAAVKKEGEPVSGDRGTYFKTEQGVLCVLLSDGMGSGEQAAKESISAVRILERFLRSGVEPAPAMKILNSVMLLKSSESWGYAAIDLMCIDLFTGQAGFYKYGAAPSYIRSGRIVRRVKGMTMAAGVLAGEGEPPDVVRLHIRPGALAVIASDGVVTREDDTWLRRILLDDDGTDMRALARSVVHEAGERYGYKDDMTVLAIRLEERK